MLCIIHDRETCRERIAIVHYSQWLLRKDHRMWLQCLAKYVRKWELYSTSPEMPIFPRNGWHHLDTTLHTLIQNQSELQNKTITHIYFCNNWLSTHFRPKLKSTLFYFSRRKTLHQATHFCWDWQMSYQIHWFYVALKGLGCMVQNLSMTRFTQSYYLNFINTCLNFNALSHGQTWQTDLFKSKNVYSSCTKNSGKSVRNYEENTDISNLKSMFADEFAMEMCTSTCHHSYVTSLTLWYQIYSLATKVSQNANDYIPPIVQKCPNLGWDATRSPLSNTVTCVSSSWSGNVAYCGSGIHGTVSVNGMLWILAICSPPTPAVVANCRHRGNRSDLIIFTKWQNNWWPR